MFQNISENSKNFDSQEKSEAQLREEIARLKKILEVKEEKLKTSLETGSLKKEILRVRKKIDVRGIEQEKIREKKEDKEGKNEATESYFEDLKIKRVGSTATIKQAKKIKLQIKDADVAHQLSILTSLALAKGVYYAVKLAKKIGNAYLLDRFHDAIVNELYSDLVKNKKLKAKK